MADQRKRCAALTPDDDANVVIINTCGFIDAAKQESIDTILEYAEAKESGLIDEVGFIEDARFIEDMR